MTENNTGTVSRPSPSDPLPMDSGRSAGGPQAEGGVILDAVHGAAVGALNELAEGVDFLSGSPTTLAYNEISAAMGRAGAEINRVMRESERIAADISQYPKGREVKINEVRDGAEATIREAVDSLPAAADRLKSALEDAALPSAPVGQAEASALQRVSTILGLTSEASRKDALKRLAAGSDDVAGVLLSPLGREIFTAVAGDLGSAEHKLARMEAIDALAKAGSKSAEASRKVGKILALREGLGSAWRSERSRTHRIAQ